MGSTSPSLSPTLYTGPASVVFNPWSNQRGSSKAKADEWPGCNWSWRSGAARVGSLGVQIDQILRSDCAWRHCQAMSPSRYLRLLKALVCLAILCLLVCPYFVAALTECTSTIFVNTHSALWPTHVTSTCTLFVWPYLYPCFFFFIRYWLQETFLSVTKSTLYYNLIWILIGILSSLYFSFHCHLLHCRLHTWLSERLAEAETINFLSLFLTQREK